MISTMLGAWQIGDTDKLHESYADDVTIVSRRSVRRSIGWTNYLPLYQQQRARMQQVRMDRSNTFIKVNWNLWLGVPISGIFPAHDRRPAVRFAGANHAVVVEKRNGKWLIVLNHTSQIGRR